MPPLQTGHLVLYQTVSLGCVTEVPQRELPAQSKADIDNITL